MLGPTTRNSKINFMSELEELQSEMNENLDIFEVSKSESKYQSESEEDDS